MSLHFSIVIIMEPESTTIRVKNTTAKTLREFCNRTQTNQIDLMTELGTQIQLLLDIMESGKKLLYLVDFDNKNRMVHIRLSDALMTCFDQIDPEMRTEILKAFGYSNDGKFTDLREKQQPRPPQEGNKA